MVDIYYPYFAREATWQELRYSLRSIERFFKFDYQVWIVGDLPDWINPESVKHIPHTRCEGMTENTLYDAITKIMLYMNHPQSAGSFIRMYDDIYLLKDVTLEQIGQYKAMYCWDRVPVRYGTWWEQLQRTLSMVRAKGYPGWNTETHLPELFLKHRMQWIIQSYGALENRLLTSSLYWNTFYPFSQPLMWSKEFAIQFYNSQENEFYTSNAGNIFEKCKGKTYLNHNASGLNDDLKDFLQQTFPNPSIFELWQSPN